METGPRPPGEDPRARAERLALTLDTVPVLISYVDAERRYRFANRTYEAWFVRSRSGIMDRRVEEVLPPRAWEQVRPRVEAVLAGEELHFEETVAYPDGRERFVRASYLPQRGPDGKVAGFVGLVQDLTDRRRMEEALREKEGFLESIYNGAEEAIFTVDIREDGRYVFTGFNPAYLRRSRDWGVDMREFLGRTTVDLLEHFPEELVAAVEAKYAECIASPGTIEFEDTIPVGGRPTYWLSHLTALRDERGRAWRLIGTAVEITRQKEDAARLRAAEEQLRQSQKMEAVGRLAGGIAHDFNNLLTAIIGLSDLALHAGDDPAAMRGMLAEIKGSGERAARLTAQLLAFSRKQILSPRVIDLNGVVAGMDSLLRRVIGEDISFVTRLAPGLRPVRIDPGQLEQIVLNLAVNSRDAMPGGGRLVLETFPAEEGVPVPGRGEIQAGPHVVLAISDNGAGMPPEVKERLFEPFFTTKEQGKGTGMGLATVYGIVRQSGGHIHVYSEPGKGTTFKVFFPAAAEAAPPVPGPERPQPPAPARGKGETLLLVEDEDAVRDYARRVLEGVGYRVLLAAHGKEALDLSAREAGPIGLLVTDVVMPGMGGRQLWDRLREDRPGLRVLFVSGYTETAIVHHGVLDQDVPFLAKPFTPSQLAAKVGALLAEPAPG